jgi:hypothetical protein
LSELSIALDHARANARYVPWRFSANSLASVGSDA